MRYVPGAALGLPRSLSPLYLRRRQLSAASRLVIAATVLAGAGVTAFFMHVA